MAERTNANIGFEKQLWDAACVLWGHIPAAEYRKVIIGLIFLRYISAAFEKRYQELVDEGDGFEDDRDAYAMENVFFVPEEARWSYISKYSKSEELGKILDEAFIAIEKQNSELKNILPKTYSIVSIVPGNGVDKSLPAKQKAGNFIWASHIKIAIIF